MNFYALVQQCTNHFEEKQVTAAITDTESTFNPFAIGVVGGAVKQPQDLQTAIMTVRALKKAGRNFSVGLMQVNQSNFAKYGLTEATMFDPCNNINAGMSIFRNCFDAANRKFGNKYSYDAKLRLAASCYYSGNFKTGFKADFAGQPPYVVKFYNNLAKHRGQYVRNGQSLLSQPLPLQQQREEMVTNAQQSSENQYSSLIEAINEQKKAVQTVNIPLPPTEEIQSTVSKKNHSWDIFQEF